MTQTTLRKSIIPIKDDPIEGPDIEYGTLIIFNYNGEDHEGVCTGWRREYSDGSCQIKAQCNDVTHYFYPITVPHTQVWRVWDKRDDIILKLVDFVSDNPQAQAELKARYDIKEIES